MSETCLVSKLPIELIQGDITETDAEAFVFYAQPSLEIGSGFGTAISVRGGPSIKAELEGKGPLGTSQVAVTSAGKLNADYIIHAVGPRFLEEDLESKLKETILNCLQKAAELGVQSLALPAMGAGFYGIPLSLCARVMITTLSDHNSRPSSLQKIIICLGDKREMTEFKRHLSEESSQEEVS